MLLGKIPTRCYAIVPVIFFDALEFVFAIVTSNAIHVTTEGNHAMTPSSFGEWSNFDPVV